jgi:hypothetical protein
VHPLGDQPVVDLDQAVPKEEEVVASSGATGKIPNRLDGCMVLIRAS